MAQVEVVEKKSRVEKTEEKKVRAIRRTPFGAPRKPNNKFKPKGDIVKDTVSRPDKRYDKVKKVKAEYIKTEDFSANRGNKFRVKNKKYQK